MIRLSIEEQMKLPVTDLAIVIYEIKEHERFKAFQERVRLEHNERANRYYHKIKLHESV